MPKPLSISLERDYFDEALQRAVATRLAEAMVEGGALVVGAHEAPPTARFVPWPGVDHVYQRAG